MPLFGFFDMSPFSVLLLFLVGLFLCMSYAAVYTLIGMLISNKAYAAIACVLAAFVLLFAAIYFIQLLAQPEMYDQANIINGEVVVENVKNPHYVTGIRRNLYQVVIDFLPSGQAMQLSGGEVLHPYQMIGYSAVITAAANIIGIFFFRRKDIK